MHIWMRIWIRCIIWFFQNIGMDLGNKSIIFSRMLSGISSNLMHFVMSSKILDIIFLLSLLRKRNSFFSHSHLGCPCKEEQIILKRFMHSEKQSEYDLVCWGPLTVGLQLTVGVWVGVGLGSGLVWAKDSFIVAG